jgi:hypothetical protein
VALVLVSVTSNEADDARGSGNTSPDITGADLGTDDFNFFVRAERSGGGNGRIYTATYAATDASGNTASTSDVVIVPHDRGHGNGNGHGNGGSDGGGDDGGTGATVLPARDTETPRQWPRQRPSLSSPHNSAFTGSRPPRTSRGGRFPS